MSEVTRDEFVQLQAQVAENTKRLADGDSTLKLINFRLDQIDDKLAKLDKGVEDLKQKPARRWDAITGQVVNWIIALLLGVLAVKIGLG